MAVWTEKTGSGYAPSRPHLFREETRTWYVWMNRATSTSALNVRIYHSLSDANASNGWYAASGSVAWPFTDLRHVVTLSNAVATPPTFTGAKVTVELDSLSQVGVNVWSCDLGTRIARSVLRVHRAFSAVSIANGYFIDVDTCQLGLMTWEEAKKKGKLPFVGVAGAALGAEETEIGDRGLATTLRIQCKAHLEQDPRDPTMFHFLDDLRRALRAIVVTYDGSVDDGLIYDVAEIVAVDKDLAIEFASEEGTLEFDVECLFNESNAEITGG